MNNKQYIDVNDILTVSLTFLTNVTPYQEKHIVAYDEEQAVYRCQRHFNSISLTFLTNVTPYHENISWHETNNKQYIDVNDISTVYH